jgi:hypothetical protein
MVILVTNLVIFAAVTSEHDGFRAMGFAYVVAPAANVIVAVILLALVPFVRRSCPRAPLMLYVLICVVGPLIAIMFDPIIIRRIWRW